MKHTHQPHPSAEKSPSYRRQRKKSGNDLAFVEIDGRRHYLGPRSLKTVRQKMIDMGWCRPYINKQINRIRHLFKWAVGDELVPGAVLHSLQAVPGLRKGRGDAPEPDPVKPVAIEQVNAVEPYVSRQVWAMIQLQLFTGARSGELTIMRPCDIDRSDNVWLYRPQHHKTAHHGHHRRIYIGPRAQKVLAPFLLRDPKPQ